MFLDSQDSQFAACSLKGVSYSHAYGRLGRCSQCFSEVEVSVLEKAVQWGEGNDTIFTVLSVAGIASRRGSPGVPVSTGREVRGDHRPPSWWLWGCVGLTVGGGHQRTRVRQHPPFSSAEEEEDPDWGQGAGREHTAAYDFSYCPSPPRVTSLDVSWQPRILVIFWP